MFKTIAGRLMPAMLAIVATAFAGVRIASAGEGVAYELEFRSRASEYFGHSYVVARKIGRSGKALSERLAGFDPVPGTPLVATLRGVRGVVDATPADRSTPPDERFKVRVSRAQYGRAMAKIEANARRHPTFNLTEQNCNTFVGRVARAAGLNAPERSAELPREYVRQMREVNSAR